MKIVKCVEIYKGFWEYYFEYKTLYILFKKHVISYL